MVRIQYKGGLVKVATSAILKPRSSALNAQRKRQAYLAIKSYCISNLSVVRAISSMYVKPVPPAADTANYLIRQKVGCAKSAMSWARLTVLVAKN